jgi:uncharacterized protein (UPF0333 family)
MEREVVMTDFEIKMRGMTKIDSIVLVCVICLVIGMAMAFSLIPHQERELIKGKMFEVTNAMSNVARAVTAYNQDLNSWPHCDGVLTIQNSLGYTLSKQTIDRISSMTVTSPRAEEVIITATIKGIDSRVDGKNVTLTGKRSERGILWVWGGTVPSTYVPKK